MSWNDASVKLLKKLWADGLSCSQISRFLYLETGGHFTRNAVIGKIHRMGLQERNAPPRKTAARPRLKLPPTPLPDEPPACEPDAVVLQSGAHVTIATVGSKQCRWPHGDPQSMDFHLCGHQISDPMSPYCDFHTRRAYSPQASQYRRYERDALAEIARNARALEAA